MNSPLINLNVYTNATPNIAVISNSSVNVVATGADINTAISTALSNHAANIVVYIQAAVAAGKRYTRLTQPTVQVTDSVRVVATGRISEVSIFVYSYYLEYPVAQQPNVPTN
jgi:hypothetical protein